MSEILQLPNDVLLNKTRQVAERVREAGGRALLVGGYVRDALLNLSPKDADLEVSGLEADVLRKVLQRCGRVGCVGESFRVYKLSWHQNDERFELDVSLPRRDKKVGQGHRGFEVEGDPHASFEDAARRRDFTVNAIMCDPLTGEIIDPFGGRNDLNNRVLKMVDAEHFAEDSLRVLRACQFAARFEMSVDEATAELCRQIDLSDLPRERIWGEWEKLLKAEKPSIGLCVAYDLEVLEKLLIGLNIEMFCNPKRLCTAIDNAAKESIGLSNPQRNALLLAVIGPRFSRHHIVARDNAEIVLEQLGVFKQDGYDIRTQVLSLAKCSASLHSWFEYDDELSNGDIRRLAGRCEPILLWKLARSLGYPEVAVWIEKRMRELGVESGPPSPLLLGRHLLEMGLNPGPRIGEITRAVYEQQLDGDVSTLEEAREFAQKLIEHESAT